MSSISRLMWRGSSVNSWPDKWKGFTFHKLLCFLIFDNAVCQFFTFYPTWDPIRECRQAPSEERDSQFCLGHGNLSTDFKRQWIRFLKRCQKWGFFLYFWGLQTTVQTKGNMLMCTLNCCIGFSLPGWCLYVCRSSWPPHALQERFHGSELR